MCVACSMAPKGKCTMRENKTAHIFYLCQVLVLTNFPTAAAVGGARGWSRVRDGVHHFQTSVQMIVSSCLPCQGCHTSSFKLWLLLW